MLWLAQAFTKSYQPLLMNATYWTIFLISSIGIIALLTAPKGNRRGIRITIAILALLAFAFCLYQLFPIPEGQTKGGKTSDIYPIIWLYIFTLLGAVSRELYRFVTSGKKKLKWRGFVAALLASPIVMIPLISVFSTFTESIAEAPASARFMIFFIAYEHGFFWKAIMESRNEKIESS